MFEEQVGNDIAGDPVGEEELEGFEDGEFRTGSAGVAKLAFFHGPDLEVVAVAFRVTPEFPFPIVFGGHGILDGLAVLGERRVLRDHQVIGPFCAGEDDLFPVGRWFRARRIHGKEDTRSAAWMEAIGFGRAELSGCGRWVGLGMRRKHSRGESDTITDPLLATAARVRLSGELLMALVHRWVASEKVAQRFRVAVIHRLSRIEIMGKMIHGAQIAECHGSKPGSEASRKEHVAYAEKFIEENSLEDCLKCVKYVYGGNEERDRPRGRKRKWSGWEI